MLTKNKTKYLVGDIGNTFTKLSLLNQNYKIIKSFNIKTEKLNNRKINADFFKKILKRQVNKKIIFSSVVPKTYKNIKSLLSKKNYISYEIKKLKIKKLIKIKVKNTKQVGSDRIANAIGSYYKYKKNCIVIDFGTATTFDIVKKPGIYDGGVIAPGINLSMINLNKYTALLPLFNLKAGIKSYGKNTKDALNAGFIWGYQGLINNIIKKISLTSKTNYKIILTGGYANHFKKYINNKAKVDQNITIEGIIKIYKELLK
ncbi:type III pantothenate kinase [Pelagibacteraceae bacterium]|nr:type III pantothenate kinase [Pelagibacteraceae bacterium]